SATHSAAAPPSGRINGVATLNSKSSRAMCERRGLTLPASNQSARRRNLRSQSQAKGTASMPLAASQVSPPKQSTVKAAANATSGDKSRSAMARVSIATMPRLKNPSAQAHQMMPTSETPTQNAGASNAGHSKLVAPAAGAEPGVYSNGVRFAKARAN